MRPVLQLFLATFCRMHPDPRFAVLESSLKAYFKFKPYYDLLRELTVFYPDYVKVSVLFCPRQIM